MQADRPRAGSLAPLLLLLAACLIIFRQGRMQPSLGRKKNKRSHGQDRKMQKFTHDKFRIVKPIQASNIHEYLRKSEKYKSKPISGAQAESRVQRKLGRYLNALDISDKSQIAKLRERDHWLQNTVANEARYRNDSEYDNVDTMKMLQERCQGEIKVLKEIERSGDSSAPESKFMVKEMLDQIERKRLQIAYESMADTHKKRMQVQVEEESEKMMWDMANAFSAMIPKLDESVNTAKRARHARSTFQTLVGEGWEHVAEAFLPERLHEKLYRDKKLDSPATTLIDAKEIPSSLQSDRTTARRLRRMVRKYKQSGRAKKQGGAVP
mmetsp:Transcript_9062/g.14457  ORF Transcript_9062/g.14457 Transcript_9062/m.14457 type:complete len:324 (-) Transcript_9062:118-1089(-)